MLTSFIALTQIPYALRELVNKPQERKKLKPGKVNRCSWGEVEVEAAAAAVVVVQKQTSAPWGSEYML